MQPLVEQIRAFAAARDWDQFHTPKNLAMALAGEVGELVAIFQWLTPDESLQVLADQETADDVRDEIADVLIYLVRLADVLGVDPVELAKTKMRTNEDRYLREASTGSATKYNRLGGTDSKLRPRDGDKSNPVHDGRTLTR